MVRSLSDSRKIALNQEIVFLGAPENEPGRGGGRGAGVLRLRQSASGVLKLKLIFGSSPYRRLSPDIHLLSNPATAFNRRNIR